MADYNKQAQSTKRKTRHYSIRANTEFWMDLLFSKEETTKVWFVVLRVSYTNQ